jgi:hypothetical protein
MDNGILIGTIRNAVHRAIETKRACGLTEKIKRAYFLSFQQHSVDPFFPPLYSADGR